MKAERGPIFRGWLRVTCEVNGKTYYQIDALGDAVLSMTCKELDPYERTPNEKRNGIARRDIYYHVWEGDRHTVCTPYRKDALVYWWDLKERAR